MTTPKTLSLTQSETMTLLVKAHTLSIANLACLQHGLRPCAFGQLRNGREVRVDVVRSNDTLEKCIRWFCADSDIDAPYPEGSLLIYR